jgi:hypothetical protein
VNFDAAVVVNESELAKLIHEKAPPVRGDDITICSFATTVRDDPGRMGIFRSLHISTEVSIPNAVESRDYSPFPDREGGPPGSWWPMPRAPRNGTPVNAVKRLRHKGLWARGRLANLPVEGIVRHDDKRG